MPGPPTPVSGCPLKRLEIRDGGSVKAFNSRRPNSIFTLTIEGERPIDAETGTLILLIYQGVQQVVSIRLGDLARNSQAPGDTVSIDKHLNQLCITIPGKGQAIIAQFEEKRDFSVTVCLLQKSDLHVGDSIPSFSQAAQTPFDSSINRSLLSSVPPMAFVSPTVQGFGANGFPAMDPHIHPSLQPTPYILHPQRTPSVPIYSSPSIPPDMAHRNPYNMFLGRGNNNMHVPRVGSHLRHSYNTESRQSSTSNAGPVLEVFSPTNNQSLEGGDGLHASASPEKVENGEKTPVYTNHSPNVDYQGTQPKSGDFRDLMPRPRKLPFESRPKRPISQPLAVVREIQKPRTRTKRARDAASEPPSNAESQRVKTKRLRTSSLRADPTMRSSTPSPSRLTQRPMSEQLPNTGCSRDAECQTEDAIGSSSYQQTDQPQFPIPDQTILIADPDTLRELDEATASLFEQYEADIANGSDNRTSAGFYLEQIYSRRRDFWFAKLEEMAAGQWQQLSR